MACTGSGLLVWDWERFTAPAPLGFDALHYWLQTEVVGQPARSGAERGRAASDRAPALLDAVRCASDRRRALSALLYLADLSVRYLADRQEQAGAALGAPRRWLLPALDRRRSPGCVQRGEGG